MIEAANDRDEEFGRERLAAVALKNRLRPAAELQAALLAEVRAFCGRDDFADDFTLMVVKYLG